MSDTPTGPPVNSLEPARLAIIERLRAHPRMKGLYIHRGQLTDGESAPVDTDVLIKGYVCVVFGGRGKVRLGWQGITGTRNNLRSWIIGLEIYARDNVAKDRIADDCFEILEGFIPPSCVELENTFSGKIENPLSTMASFSREGIGMLFDTTIDMGTVV